MSTGGGLADTLTQALYDGLIRSGLVLTLRDHGTRWLVTWDEQVTGVYAFPYPADEGARSVHCYGDDEHEAAAEIAHDILSGRVIGWGVL